MQKKVKRANILVENVVFIILNLAFFMILFLFLLKQGSGAVIVEEIYAKQIALLLDSAKPGMEIKLNVQELSELITKNNVALENMITIDKNQVIVRLTKESSYSYSFFNNVKVSTPAYSTEKNSKGEDELFLNLVIDKAVKAGEQNE